MRFLSICIFISILLWACKSDTSLSVPAHEQKYFDNYKSPKKKWGFIDTSGAVAIKAKFDDVKDFANDMAAANYKGKWGFINTSGENKIEYKYKQAYNFTAAQTVVQDFESNWLLIDMAGAIIDTLHYDAYAPYIGDYCKVANKNKWGLIDKNGEEIIPCAYTSIKHFNTNLIGLKKRDLWGLRSISGDTLLPFQSKKLTTLDGNIFKLKSDQGYSFYNLETQNQSTHFTSAYDFEDGAALVQDAGFKLIDAQYEIIHQFEQDFLVPVGERKYKFKVNNKWGLVDDKGNIIAQPRYDAFNRFVANRLVFQKGEYFGYLDQTGKEIVPAQLYLAWDFHDDMARIISPNGMCFMDLDGNTTLVSKYFEVRDFKQGLARFQKN